MKQQNTNTTNQKELANQYCTEIDTYIEQQINPCITKREKLEKTTNKLTTASAILPTILAPTTSIATLITQQFWIAFINIANAILPAITAKYKNDLNKYNGCTQLKINFTSLKGDIRRIESINGLKDENLKEIDIELKKQIETLKQYINQIEN